MNKLTCLGMAILPATVAGNVHAQNKAPKQQDSPKRPNIVYIMSDDHSFQTISAYGHQLGRLAPTPNLDRIANEGMIFTKAFVENSISTPSRACLMTGLYSHQSGQLRFDRTIDTTKVFFSELLQQAGYQTAVIGKWHIECEPKGFDRFCIVGGQGDYYTPAFRTNTSGGEYIKEEGYATNLITDHSIEFMENRDPDKPFCLLIHHKAPHRNWMPDTTHIDLYEDIEFPKPETFYDDYSTRCGAARNQDMSIDKTLTMSSDLKVVELADDPEQFNKDSGWATTGPLARMTHKQRGRWISTYYPRNMAFIEQNLTGNELLDWKYQRYIRDYLRCIKSIDDQVGRVLDYLEKEGLLDNTVVIYTSDQGFYMGEHGWFDKRFMYEESFRTPLMIRYPAMIQAGTQCDALVQNIDNAPTILSFAGVEKPEEMSGRPLEALFGGEKPKNWRKDIYYHYYDNHGAHDVQKHDGVRTDRYKLIHFYDELRGSDRPVVCNELYDLETDPNELNNLYGNPQYKKIQGQLQTTLDKYRKDLKVAEY